MLQIKTCSGADSIREPVASAEIGFHAESGLRSVAYLPDIQPQADFRFSEYLFGEIERVAGLGHETYDEVLVFNLPVAENIEIDVDACSQIVGDVVPSSGGEAETVGRAVPSALKRHGLKRIRRNLSDNAELTCGCAGKDDEAEHNCQ